MTPPPSAREVSAGYGELALVEAPAIDLLIALGWTFANLYAETFGEQGTERRESEHQVVLTRRLRVALESLNPGLQADAYAQAVEQITQDRSKQLAVNANRDVFRLLRDGVKVKVADERGGHSIETLRVIDWANPGNNDFFLASQMWVAGDMYRRRCDLLGFVNGLPLVFIELKAPSVPLKAAHDDNLRDYRGQSIPQLFHPNAFILLSNGRETKVGTLTSEWEHFFEWKRIDEESEAPKVSLETALRGLCDKARLLDIIENFTLFEEGKGGLIKKVAKNHQYLGVAKAIRRLVELHESDAAERKRLGVFWHTQGSGKSLSMVFFTQKVLRKLPDNWTFVIVTDREELDDQIAKTFKNTGAITKGEVRATSGEHLRQLLREDNRYVFTLIQKFRTPGAGEKSEVFPVLSERSDIIVITDEAHRSQYDVFAMNMRQALPNAAFIGFTGTPLIKGEEERTREVFGDYVSIYDFARSIEDGATVPLYYENRIPELELTNHSLNEQMERLLEDAELDEEQEKRLEREFAREYHLITRDDRLEAIAADVVRHFLGRGYRGKAMVISIDKATAVRMYDKVRRHWDQHLAHLRAVSAKVSGEDKAALDQTIAMMEATDMAVVVSQSQNEVEDLRKKGLDIRPHRERINKEELDEAFKDDENPLRLVFVCAMWITGFDVPTCSTIYLDKPMKGHTLMQTIARANRVAPGKTSGLIVDYVGIFRYLEDALAIYARPGSSGKGLPIEDKRELVEALRSHILGAEAFCKSLGIDLDGIVRSDGFERTGRIGDAVDALVATEETKKEYLQLAARVARLFKAILPDPKANEHAPLAILIAFLAKAIKSLTPSPDIAEVMADVESLLNDSIATQGYKIGPAPTSQPLINLSEIDFKELDRKFAEGRQRTEAEKLKALLESQTRRLVTLNHSRMDYLQKLQELIDEYNSGSRNVEQLFEELKRFARSLSEEEQRAAREGLTEEELAIFDILTKPEPKLARAEEEQVKKVAKDLLAKLKSDTLVLDWREKPQARAEVQRTIRDLMIQLPPAYTVQLRKEKRDRTYSHVFDCYFGAGGSIYGATGMQ